MVPKRLAFAWSARQQFKMLLALMRDGRIPLWKKVVPLLPFLYLFSPFNFLSMSVPFVGQIDDVLLILTSMKLFEWLVDKDIVAEYQQS